MCREPDCRVHSMVVRELIMLSLYLVTTSLSTSSVCTLLLPTDRGDIDIALALGLVIFLARHPHSVPVVVRIGALEFRKELTALLSSCFSHHE